MEHGIGLPRGVAAWEWFRTMSYKLRITFQNLERGVDDIKSNKCGISYECYMGIIVGG